MEAYELDVDMDDAFGPKGTDLNLADFESFLCPPKPA